MIPKKNVTSFSKEILKAFKYTPVKIPDVSESFTCFNCKTLFSPKKNKIILKPVIILLKNSDSFQTICPKCSIQIDENNTVVMLDLKTYMKNKYSYNFKFKEIKNERDQRSI